MMVELRLRLGTSAGNFVPIERLWFGVIFQTAVVRREDVRRSSRRLHIRDINYA